MLKMSAFSIDTGRQTTPPAQTSTTGCSFNGHRHSQLLQKVLHTTLAPFLVWKSLINRITPYFFDSQIFL